MAVPAAAGAAAAAQIVPALIGRGKSNYNAQDISHSQMYDPFAYQVGNYGAENYKEGRESQAREIDRRSAPQADYAQADADRRRALEARAGQASVMGQLMARANGQTPSIAQMQADRQMGQASAQQAALQASARGRGALANSATTAANNTANAHGAISNQAQINAAQERQQAEQAAFGAASAMRGQDYQSQGQAANQAQYQAGLQMQNRQTNDARAIQTQQMGHQGLMQEQQGRVAMQGVSAQSHANAQATNAKTEAQNAENKGIIESIGDFFSDRNAKYVLSDFTSKFTAGGMMPQMGGGMNAGGSRMGGHFGGGAEQIDAGGGMNTQFGTEWNNSELSGMSGGGMSNPMEGGGIMSDDRTKLAAAWDQGHKAALQDVSKRGGTEAAKAVQIDRATSEQMRVNEKRGGKAGGDSSMVRDAVAESMAKRNALVDSRPVSGGEVGHAAKPASYDRPGSEVQPLTEEERKQQPWYRGPPPSAPQQAAPPEEDGVLASVGRFFSSDFTSKEPLTLNKGGARFGPPADFDEKNPGAFAEPARAGQAQFAPGRGWVQDGADAKDEGKAYLDDEIGARVNEDRERDEWNAKVADNDRKLATQAEWQRQASEEEEPWSTDADGKPVRMAPGTADMAKTQPKPGEGGDEKEEVPLWLRTLVTSGRNLNEAQFGSRGAGIAGFRSDFTSKEAIDLDAYAKEDYDVGEGPGDRDFDADAHVESNVPKPYEREGVTRVNSRAEHEAAVQARDRAVQDKAGRDADDLMASMGQSLKRGASAKVEASGEPPDLRDAARLRDEALRPENSPMARANRTMRGVPYIYKPQYTPPDQKPGEVNWGFMAQNLKKEPPTATAVKEDAEGMQRVDAMKLLRILGASVADLQKQQDETRLALSKGGRR
jgi:hypothetical protein